VSLFDIFFYIFCILSILKWGVAYGKGGCCILKGGLHIMHIIHIMHMTTYHAYLAYYAYNYIYGFIVRI
jgi:hypothetical protein